MITVPLAALLAAVLALGGPVPPRRRTPIEHAVRRMVATALADRSWRDEYRNVFVTHGVMARVRDDVAFDQYRRPVRQPEQWGLAA